MSKVSAVTSRVPSGAGSIATPAVMEGGGSYNQNAKIPAGGGRLAVPLLEEAARKIPLAERQEPIFIADYGSSQGKNSLAPMRAAISRRLSATSACRETLLLLMRKMCDPIQTNRGALRLAAGPLVVLH